MAVKDKKQKRDRRHARIRAKVVGTKKRPRLAVFKSNNGISAQLIDDDSNQTIGGVISSKIAGDKKGSEQAEAVGIAIADVASKNKISEVVFDRGGFIYTGKIKALAEGARKAGLKF